MVKYKLGATVPVAQYANLIPEIEVEAETIEEAEKMVLPYIKKFFNEYAEKGKRIGAQQASKSRKLEKDIFGNEIYFDSAQHIYTNSLGEVYMSGSRFASQFEKPFDAQAISEMLVNKHKLTKNDIQEIQKMWELKAEASASFGTAIHAALELYGKYKKLSSSMQKTTHLHDGPALQRAVEAFYKEYPEVDNIEYEALVVDHANKRAGRIDRLEKEKDGLVVADFKTNYDLDKSLKKFWVQLSFYAAIVEANGHKVKGLRIYHWDDKEWVTVEHKVLDIEKLKK